MAQLAGSQSMPDLTAALGDGTENVYEADLDFDHAPPSPLAVYDSRSPSPDIRGNLTTTPVQHSMHAFPAKHVDQWSHTAEDDDDSDYEEAQDSTPSTSRVGQAGTYALHHPERAHSDYSIHSAPELERNGHHDQADDEDSMMRDSMVESISAAASAHTTPATSRRHSTRTLQRLPYTLWDYLQQEVSGRRQSCVFSH